MLRWFWYVATGSVHDDIQLCQWLQTKEGRLKLGDFNRAEFPKFNSVEQSYCKYNNGHGYGNYRSPEEFSASDLDEKIDIFSFGNNLYALVRRKKLIVGPR